MATYGIYIFFLKEGCLHFVRTDDEAQHHIPKGDHRLNSKTIRKPLAGILSLAMLAAMLFPAITPAYAQEEAAKESLSPKITSRLSPKLQIPGQPSTSPSPLANNFILQSDSDEPITVIVELSHEPIALFQSHSSTSKTSTADQERKIRLEHLAFKTQAQNNLNIGFNREYTKAFNGYSVVIPANEVDRLTRLPSVKAVYPNLEYKTLPVDNGYVFKPLMDESAPHIGADKLWDLDVTGKGIKVGVLDTGVDMNHPSLQGAYKGGWDFVDNDDNPMETLPDSSKPPLADGTEYQTTHGTHVSGTIVGRGDPDDPTGSTGWVRGVAPEADLYVYRVLGPYGRGSTENIIAAIERSITDKMDVINLSLGGKFNNAFTADSVAVNNAMLAGVTVVLAAGNEGPEPGTVSTPGGAHIPISVGASTPPLITPTFTSAGIDTLYAQLAEYAPEITEQGKTLEAVYASLGKPEDYSSLDAAGKLVLVMRGDISFQEKAVNAAKAGAAALIIFNNAPGELKATLGAEGQYAPTYTISREAGLALLNNIEQGVTSIAFNTVQEQDLLADFSSRGPIYPDYTIKPDLTAPGVAIRSSVPSWDGDYSNAYKDSQGTSMAAPHIAGAAALLLEQYQHKIKTSELKALLMNNAVPIKDRSQRVYSVTEQGSGRVDLNETIKAQAIALVQASTSATKDKASIVYETGGVSFGLVPSGTRSQTVKVKDIAQAAQSYAISSTWSGTGNGIHLSFDHSTIDVPANGEASFNVQVEVPTQAPEGIYEGIITLTEATTQHLLRLPVSLYIGQAFEIDAITDVKVEPMLFSPNGESPQQATDVTFAVNKPLDKVSMSVTDIVYGDFMGTMYTSMEEHHPNLYGVEGWDGTVLNNGQSTPLPDGLYSLTPVANEEELDNQAGSFIIDREAPESVLDEEALIVDPLDPSMGVIRGKVTKDLLMELFPADLPISAYIAVAALDMYGAQYDGIIEEDGTFTVRVPLGIGMNQYDLFVYDSALNGTLAPAHQIEHFIPEAVAASVSKANVQTGEAFDVKVEYSVTEEVYAASFSLTYDSKLTVLQMSPSVTMATYQQEHFPGTPLQIDIDTKEEPNGMTTLNYSVSLSGGAVPNFGSIATISFASDHEGKYDFKLSQARLYNANREEIPIQHVLPGTVNVKKPNVPNPEPEPPTSPSWPGGFIGMDTSSKTLKAGKLVETKQDQIVKAVFNIDAETVKKQLQDSTVKQVLLDISDIPFKEYSEVAFRLDKSTVEQLLESKKGLMLSAAEFSLLLPSESIKPLVGTDGFELVLSLAEHKEKGFSKDGGETTFTSPMITIRGPENVKSTTMEMTMKQTVRTKDIRKAALYALDLDQAKNSVWNYDQAGIKAKDKQAITFAITQFGTYTAAEHARTFRDIVLHWAKDEIEVIAAHGLLRGKDRIDTFKPSDILTQAEFATLLDRMTNNGMTWEERIAEPGARKPITREKMVVMLVQALKADLSQTSSTAGFKDEALISSEAKAAVAYAVSKGFIKGMSNNTFDPTGTTTRAQAAILLYRVMNDQ